MRDMHPAATVHASERLSARHLIQARRPSRKEGHPRRTLFKPSPAGVSHLGCTSIYNPAPELGCCSLLRAPCGHQVDNFSCDPPQTSFHDFGNDAADPSVMTERDVQKLAKRAEKDEKAQRAAFAAFQVRMPCLLVSERWARDRFRVHCHRNITTMCWCAMFAPKTEHRHAAD